MKKALICLAVTFASLGAISSAWACSNYFTQAGEVFARPVASEQDTLPSNFMFFDAHLYQQDQTPPSGWVLQREGEDIDLTFTIHEEFAYSEGSYRTTAYWWAPEQMALSGDVLTRADCGPCFPYTITDAELEAPPKPNLELRSIEQYTASGNTCVPTVLGYVSFKLRFDDEQQATQDVLAKVYIGATVDEARQASTPLNIQHVRASTEHTLSLTMVEETSDTLSLDKPFCISVVAVDAAGQESPRSTPLCIDPQFELDPSPLYEDELEEPSCTASPQQRPVPLDLLPLLVFALVWQRRSNHTRRRASHTEYDAHGVPASRGIGSKGLS